MSAVQILALILLIAAGVWFFSMRSGSGVSSEQAHELVKQGALLLDVRTENEFKSGHIEGATNISVGGLAQRMTELGAKDRPIVVYCRSGARSARARKMLNAAGFTEVHDLGAMSRW